MKYILLAFYIAVLSLNPPRSLACDFLNANVGGFGQSDGEGNIGNIQIANLQILCDKRFRLGLNGGLNYSGIRRLSDGKGHYISYYLWQDSASNAEWGTKGISATVPHPADSFSGKGNGSVQSFTVYGTAFTHGPYPPGLYTDVIGIVLTYVPFGSSVPIETDLYISLDIVGGCTLNLAGLGDFGEWTVDSSDLTSVPLGAITINCNPPGMTYAVGMGAGMNFRGGIRHMQSGGKFIPYVIYADKGRSMPWGDRGLSLFEPGYTESHPSPARNAISTGKLQSFFVWGDAMIGTSPSGVYNDTVSVTIVWP